ncbi:DUF928 domain-containing protein [Cyanobacteria bacterium FACHB-472]|nr:DUF928 domain-containing protein [Cyanobacteria bacterium FACHB-472]
MVWIKFLLPLASLWVALTLELVIAPNTFARIQTRLASLPEKTRLASLPGKTRSHPKISNYNSHHQRQINAQLPLPPKNPDETTGGGTRDGGRCPQDALTSEPPLTALSPVTQPGLTVAERPTFLAYVPQTTAQTAEFSLFDQNNQGIYQTTFALTNTPGIISFSLPPNAPPLEIGKDYTWSFAIICDPKKRLQDHFVRGRIRRIKLDSALMNQIEKATPKERVFLYRTADVWYEAVYTLFELQRSKTAEPSMSAAWKELLNSSGLNSIATQPVEK